VNLLALVGGQEGIGADEVDFGTRAEDVGHDASAVLVGVDLGEEPLCGGVAKSAMILKLILLLTYQGEVRDSERLCPQQNELRRPLHAAQTHPSPAEVLATDFHQPRHPWSQRSYLSGCLDQHIL
jgi:hypothetical protein